MHLASVFSLDKRQRPGPDFSEVEEGMSVLARSVGATVGHGLEVRPSGITGEHGLAFLLRST